MNYEDTEFYEQILKNESKYFRIVEESEIPKEGSKLMLQTSLHRCQAGTYIVGSVLLQDKNYCSTENTLHTNYSEQMKNKRLIRVTDYMYLLKYKNDDVTNEYIRYMITLNAYFNYLENYRKQMNTPVMNDLLSQLENITE